MRINLFLAIFILIILIGGIAFAVLPNGLFERMHGSYVEDSSGDVAVRAVITT